MNGQTLVKAFVPLPGGSTAVSTSTGLAYYMHSDWLGSSRLASSPARSVLWDGAYAPFGESYAESPADSSYHSFTGQHEDTAQGLDDFLFREYSASQQGRWISPDPAGMAAVDIANPQTWNRYAYVMNQPLVLIDPMGLDASCTSFTVGMFGSLIVNCSSNGFGMPPTTGVPGDAPGSFETIGGHEGPNLRIYRMVDGLFDVTGGDPTSTQTPTENCQQHGQLSFNLPLTHIPVTISLSFTPFVVNYSSTNDVTAVIPIPPALSFGASLDVTVNAPTEPTPSVNIGAGKNLSAGTFVTPNGPKGLAFSVGPSIGPPGDHVASSRQRVRRPCSKGGWLRVAIFPGPGPERPGVRIFLAPRLWEFNICGAVVAGVAGCVLLVAIAGILIWQTRRVEWLAVLLVLNVVIGAPLMFRPGNLVAMFPYAAELEEGKGVRFYAPFNSLYIRIEELKQVAWSYARTGWVIKLKRRHGLVGRLVIHAAWGSQGRELAGAIENELVPIGG